MRSSLVIVDGQLTIDDLYRTAQAPYALISIIFARFDHLSSRIIVFVLEKYGPLINVSTFFGGRGGGGGEEGMGGSLAYLAIVTCGYTRSF